MRAPIHCPLPPLPNDRRTAAAIRYIDATPHVTRAAPCSYRVWPPSLRQVLNRPATARPLARGAAEPLRCAH
eukprot:1072955-Prymnesium_polylepis.1